MLCCVLYIFQGEPGATGPEGELGSQGVLGHPGEKVTERESPSADPLTNVFSFV